MSQDSHLITVTFQTMNNMTFHLYSNLLKNVFLPTTQLNAKDIYIQGGK